MSADNLGSWFKAAQGKIPAPALTEAAGGGGHWVTIEDDEGVATHIFIGHGGIVSKGPKHLIGANIAHLPAAPHFHHTHHPEGHNPKGHNKHPSYHEHQFKKKVYGHWGPGEGTWVGNPLPKQTKEEAEANFHKAHHESRQAAGKGEHPATTEYNKGKAGEEKPAAKPEEKPEPKAAEKKEEPKPEKKPEDSQKALTAINKSGLGIHDKLAIAKQHSAGRLSAEELHAKIAKKQTAALPAAHGKLAATLKAAQDKKAQDEIDKAHEAGHIGKFAHGYLHSLVKGGKTDMVAKELHKKKAEQATGMLKHAAHVGHITPGEHSVAKHQMDTGTHSPEKVLDWLKGKAKEAGAPPPPTPASGPHVDLIGNNIDDAHQAGHISASARDNLKHMLHSGTASPIEIQKQLEKSVLAHHIDSAVDKGTINNAQHVSLWKGYHQGQPVPQLKMALASMQHIHASNALYSAMQQGHISPEEQKSFQHSFDHGKFTPEAIHKLTDEAKAQHELHNPAGAHPEPEEQRDKAFSPRQASTPKPPPSSAPYQSVQHTTASVQSALKQAYTNGQIDDENDFKTLYNKAKSKPAIAMAYLTNLYKPGGNFIRDDETYDAWNKLDDALGNGKIDEDTYHNLRDESRINAQSALDKLAQHLEDAKEPTGNEKSTVPLGKATAHITKAMAKQTRLVMKKLLTWADGTKIDKQDYNDRARAKMEIASALGPKLAAAGITAQQAKDLYSRLVLGDHGNSSDPHERLASGIVSQWAGTSADHSPASLAIQMAAKHEFGLGGWESKPGHVSQQAWDQGHAIASDLVHGARLRKVVRTMYDHTQENLKSMGVTHVTLARGCKDFSHPELVSGYKKAMAEGKSMVVDMPAGEIEQNPLASWSTNHNEAHNFTTVSDNPSYAHKVNCLFVSTVPASQVFSHLRTGNGCMDEEEMVLLGHPTPMVVTADQEHSRWKEAIREIVTGKGYVPQHPANVHAMKQHLAAVGKKAKALGTAKPQTDKQINAKASTMALKALKGHGRKEWAALGNHAAPGSKPPTHAEEMARYGITPKEEAEDTAAGSAHHAATKAANAGIINDYTRNHYQDKLAKGELTDSDVHQRLRAHAALTHAAKIIPSMTASGTVQYPTGAQFSTHAMARYYGMHLREGALNPRKLREMMQHNLELHYQKELRGESHETGKYPVNQDHDKAAVAAKYEEHKDAGELINQAVAQGHLDKHVGAAWMGDVGSSKLDMATLKSRLDALKNSKDKFAAYQKKMGLAS